MISFLTSFSVFYWVAFHSVLQHCEYIHVYILSNLPPQGFALTNELKAIRVVVDPNATST